MEFKPKQKFINDLVLKESPEMQLAVFKYTEYAYKNGARECNDGYPDCNYKGTMRVHDNKARKLIAEFRERYTHEERLKSLACHVLVEGSKSKPEVARGFLNQIRYMLSKG